MFAKSVFEPIKDGGELNEGEEGGGEFFVTGADPTVPFDPAKIIFYAMPAPIEATIKGARTAAFLTARNEALSSDIRDSRTNTVGIKTLVCHQSATAQKAEMLFDRFHIIACARMQAQRDGSSVRIHEHRELGIEPPLGSSDSLALLPTGGSCRVLV